MAKGIRDLIGDEVQLTMTEPSARGAVTGGVLESEDERGILLSAEDPTDGPIRVFVPWTAISWIRAVGEYKKREAKVVPKPPGL